LYATYFITNQLKNSSEKNATKMYTRNSILETISKLQAQKVKTF